MIEIIVGGRVLDIPNWEVITLAVVSIAIALTFYTLRSIGLFVLAKRNGVKNAWMSFVPFFWAYVVAKLCGEIKLFNSSVSSWAWGIGTFIASIGVLTTVYNVLVYLPAVGYYLQGGVIYFADVAPAGTEIYWTGQFFVKDIVYPYANVEAMASFLNILGYFVNVLGIISTISGAFLFFCFFRSYWPEHYILAGIFSIFGFFGIFAFVVRNKKRIDYAEYIRSRFNVYNGYNGAYRNPNAGEPFGGYGGTGESDDDFGWNSGRRGGNGEPADNPENGENGNSGNAPSDDPFGEFSDNKDDDKQ